MNSRFTFYNIILGFVVGLSHAQHLSHIIPQSYVAQKTSETMVIDGLANEESWSKARWTQDFIDIEGDVIPTYKTNVKMLWDDTHFYILADIKEPHIWGTLKQRDTVIFYNNDFEVFIDPDGDTHNYYELEINALNTVWDLFIGKPYREPNNIVLNDWTLTALKSAISIDGTLNQSNDIDQGWLLEIAIPFKALRTGRRNNNVPYNTYWRINFSRVNWDFDLKKGTYFRKKDNFGKFLPEYNWVWSPTGVINMHLPELWGYVFFSTKEIGANETFEIPDDEKIKWKLYDLHRAQKGYYHKHHKWANSLQELNPSSIKVNNRALNPVFEIHSYGYTISIRSPFTGDLLIIDEEGKFKKR